MQSRIVLISLAALAALCTAGNAVAVPNVVNFQGVVRGQGIPINGTATFKFSLVDAQGQTLWSNDGSTGVEPAAGVSLPVSNSIFVAPLGDTAMGFAALPSPSFPVDARVRVWVSGNGSSFERLTPDAPLSSAPYALTAETANTVGGLSSVAISRAPFVAGFRSGLPAASEILPVPLPGNYGYTGAAGQFVSFSTQRLLDTTGQPIGSVQPGEVVLRRPLTSDRSWLDNARLQRHAPTASLVLNVNGAEAVRWDFADFRISRYAIRAGDDGQPVEEVALYALSFTRTRTITQRVGSPPGSGLPVGFVAGNTSPTSLQAGVDGVTYPGYVVPSVAFTVPQGSGGSGGGSGRPLPVPALVRQNVTDDPLLYSWFQTGARHNFTLVGVGANIFTAYTLTNAFVYQYSLRLGDDGLPVEDYTLNGTLA